MVSMAPSTLSWARMLHNKALKVECDILFRRIGNLDQRRAIVLGSWNKDDPYPIFKVNWDDPMPLIKPAGGIYSDDPIPIVKVLEHLTEDQRMKLVVQQMDLNVRHVEEQTKLDTKFAQEDINNLKVARDMLKEGLRQK